MATATPVPSASTLSPLATPPAADSATIRSGGRRVPRVFDSAVEFDPKSAHLEDPVIEGRGRGLHNAGSAMGGISLEATATPCEGATATVTYDVLFGGAAAYTAQTGTLTRVDGVWTVTKDEFCSFMASARNTCPA